MVKATYNDVPLVGDLTITGTVANVGPSPMTDKQASSLLRDFADILESYDFEARTLTINIK